MPARLSVSDRPDQVRQSIRDVQRVLADGQHAADREQSKLHRQDQNEQQAEPERRDGVPDHAEDANDLVEPRAAEAVPRSRPAAHRR